MAANANALIVDASVAVKWHLLDEEFADVAAHLLRQFMVGAVQLLAPAQIRYEVPSAILVAAGGRQPGLTAEQAREAIQEFLALGITTVDRDELILDAAALVGRHAIAFYDALYLALAQSMAVPLLTADARLYQRIRHLPNVVWIGDYTGQ